jgi:2-oxo-3-hexenedioate decarboxylase
MTPETIHKLAQALDGALLERREIEPLTKTHGSFSLEEAYAVQRACLAARQGRGEQIVGYKMGLTSRAKREQMNLGSPIYGPLTSAMRVPDAGDISIASGIHPKAEPEVAFVTARELRGSVTRQEALAACSGVAAALEILDSRFVGFKYFSLPDVVADFCSSWRFVLGEVHPLREVGELPMRLFVDGELRSEAASSAISGHPAESLVQLVAMLDAHGSALPAGSIVLAGAATAAEQLQPGMRVELQIEGLGSASLTASR